ncbi:SAG-related sequence SRS52C [Besnoitia besnoiti]|uniref:SAG-related sequence SRS52C n=1 Tax=Besnoitia besnoiti TaxID=94643 RepID=A0A2A9M944_BESBE|nr:SAG-related sequence SRS52C [Besnoitia besnoiti]PFH33714.1 SAG-related sequence SRS52C [Besnoitia besnoiti]
MKCGISPCLFQLRTTCTSTKKNLELDITAETSKLTFKCDTDIPFFSPTKASQTAYDESCTGLVELPAKLPSAKVEIVASAYTFRVEELPSTPPTVCYKCSATSGKPENAQDGAWCAVRIKVDGSVSGAGGTPPSRLAVPGFLLVLGIAFLL